VRFSQRHGFFFDQSLASAPAALAQRGLEVQRSSFKFCFFEFDKTPFWEKADLNQSPTSGAACTPFR
jgi:hypothetical protein